MKKTLLGFVSGMLLLSGYASAAYEGPLLVKTKHPALFGFPEMVKESLKCEIYEDKVHVTVTRKQNGEQIGQTLETRAFNSDEMVTLIEEAAQGQVSQLPGPYDAAPYKYQAFQVQSSDEVKAVTLVEYLGNGRLYKNQSSAAQELINLIDETCKLTN